MAQCTATARRTGRQCQKRAIAGARVCLSHGAAAPQVRRAAAERVAFQRAAELLAADATADPLEVLAAAVRASAALLGAAEAAVTADEPDPGALQQLGEAALLAGRLAKLALDSGIQQRLVRQAEEAGALVGGLLTRAVNALELPPDVSAAAFRIIRREVEAERISLGPYGDMSVAELDVEIRRVVAELDAHDQADAIAGFPARLAGALDAALEALELSDADQEKAVAAVEAFLARDAAERAERAQRRHEGAGLAPAAWWVGNGNGRGGRG